MNTSTTIKWIIGFILIIFILSSIFVSIKSPRQKVEEEIIIELK